MAEQVVKSVRLERKLVEAVDKRAGELGLTFADLVDAGLRREVGMGTNARTDVLRAVADWVRGQFPDQRGFPTDVTLLAVRAMRKDAATLADYDAAIRDAKGDVNEELRGILHRLIGQTVRRVLDAKVIGRSNPLDPCVELITTHALLEPTA